MSSRLQPFMAINEVMWLGEGEILNLKLRYVSEGNYTLVSAHHIGRNAHILVRRDIAEDLSIPEG
jgi:hypothetical protein